MMSVMPTTVSMCLWSSHSHTSLRSNSNDPITSMRYTCLPTFPANLTLYHRSLEYGYQQHILYYLLETLPISKTWCPLHTSNTYIPLIPLPVSSLILFFFFLTFSSCFGPSTHNRLTRSFFLLECHLSSVQSSPVFPKLLLMLSYSWLSLEP